MRECKEDRALHSGAQCQGKRWWAQAETQDVLSEYKEKLFIFNIFILLFYLQEGDRALA